MVLNAAHLHLMINHYPIFAAFFALVLLLIGVIRRSRVLRVSAYVALVSAAVVVIAVYLTGSMAEGAVEHVPGVLEQALDIHEDVAKISLLAVLVAGVCAAISWMFDQRSAEAPRLLVLLTMLLTLGSLVSLGYTAEVGGEIHHPEIRAVGP